MLTNISIFAIFRLAGIFPVGSADCLGASYVSPTLSIINFFPALFPTTWGPAVQYLMEYELRSIWISIEEKDRLLVISHATIDSHA